PCAVPIAAATRVTATFTLRPAMLRLTPQMQDFGAVALGGSSLPVTFTVTNSGGAAAGPFTASVDDPASYAVAGGSCLARPLPGRRPARGPPPLPPARPPGPQAGDSDGQARRGRAPRLLAHRRRAHGRGAQGRAGVGDVRSGADRRRQRRDRLHRDQRRRGAD